MKQRFSECRSALQTGVRKTLALWYNLRLDGFMDRELRIWNIASVRSLIAKDNWTREVIITCRS
jgi:hypothetical protein